MNGPPSTCALGAGAALSLQSLACACAAWREVPAAEAAARRASGTGSPCSAAVAAPGRSPSVPALPFAAMRARTSSSIRPWECSGRVRSRAASLRDGGLALAEGARQRVRLATTVAAEERGARPAVERDRAHAIAEASGVCEGDARAVTGSVQLDVADPERRADGVEILGRGARAEGISPVADPSGAARAARVDQHDVALGAQRLEQRHDGRPRRRRRRAVTAGADEDRVASLPSAVVRVDLEADGHVPGGWIGSDEGHGHRPAARAARAGSQVGRTRGNRRPRADCREGCDRDPRARRGYQRKPHPAQFGSQRSSNEMWGAPVSSALRSARWRRTKEKRN